MDKNTYEYMKKRVDAFTENQNRIAYLKKTKGELQNFGPDDSPSLRLFGRGNYELSVSISQFNAVKNVLINGLNVEIEKLEKEMEEI